MYQASVKPLDPKSRLEGLGRVRDGFLRSMVGDAPVFRVEKTGTKVDVGHWFGKVAVWISILEDEMILLAVGRRPFSERVAFDELGKTQYNHVTGEVVLAPAEASAIKTLRLSPLVALDILAYLLRGEDRDGHS